MYTLKQYLPLIVVDCVDEVVEGFVVVEVVLVDDSVIVVLVEVVEEEVLGTLVVVVDDIVDSVLGMVDVFGSVVIVVDSVEVLRVRAADELVKKNGRVTDCDCFIGLSVVDVRTKINIFSIKNHFSNKLKIILPVEIIIEFVVDAGLFVTVGIENV